MVNVCLSLGLLIKPSRAKRAELFASFNFLACAQAWLKLINKRAELFAIRACESSSLFIKAHELGSLRLNRAWLIKAQLSLNC